MKKFVWILFFLLWYLLAFPAHALESARSGLLLWYHSVLPVLFPFMLLCGLLIRFGTLNRVLPALSRPFCFLFGCSPYGAFAILVGFLCGFPMGAKITRDLLEQEKISRREAHVLYGFVNNLSPAFILSYLAADQMRLPAMGGLFLVNILGSALLYGIFSSRILRGRTSHERTFHGRTSHERTFHGSSSHGQTSHSRIFEIRSAIQTGSGLSHEDTEQSHKSPEHILASDPASVMDVQEIFRQIDNCIYDTVQNTVRLGAYIVMFSLLLGAVSRLLPSDRPAALTLTACIEVSNGVHMIANSPLSFPARYILVTALGAFGGLSALAQSASVAAMDRELLAHYIKSRVKITLLSTIMALLSVLFGLRLL